MLRCCELHLKLRQPEAAWHDYEDYLQAGGEATKLAPGTWLDLCRYAETGAAPERALAEYQKLAQALPQERQSLQAQLGAARLCLKKLGRPQEALAWFQAAHDSPIPHLDWEAAITAGMREAKAALSGAMPAAAGR